MSHSPVPAPLSPDLIVFWDFGRGQEVVAARRPDRAERPRQPARPFAGDVGFTGRPRFCSDPEPKQNHDPGIGTGRRAVSGASESARSASTRRSQASLRSPEVAWEPVETPPVRDLDWREPLRFVQPGTSLTFRPGTSLTLLDEKRPRARCPKCGQMHLSGIRTIDLAPEPSQIGRWRSA